MGQGPIQGIPSGSAPAASAPAAPAAGPAGMARSGTIIGLAAPIIPEPPPAPAPAALGTNTLPLGRRTVMGLAPPAPTSGASDSAPPFGPSAEAPVNPDPGLGHTRPLGASGAPAPNPAGPNKTILGVARPGIAPLNPGVAKTVPPEPFPSPPPPPPTPLVTEDEEAPRRTSLLALFVIVAAVALMAGGLVAFFLLRGRGPLEVKAGLTPEGHEQLELSCPGCKEGERVRLGQVATTFKAGRAQLRVPSELKVGDNPFEFSLTAPGSTRENRVALVVPLEFRVRGDVTTLTQTVPQLTVRVEAVRGSAVVVAGQPLSLAANGHGQYTLDVSQELTGLEPNVRKLERRVPYRITPPGRAAQSGEVTFQLGIAPLGLEAPGESITIESATFVLSGRTMKGGAVSVGERGISVDADGRFVQNLSVSSVGETTVTLRASAPDYAPRRYTFRVRRVASLAEEGRSVRATASTSYAAVATDIEQKRGWQVALDGNVIELGGSDHSTLLLLDVKSGCKKPPCTARVVHGARLGLTPGDRVSVFGRLRGAVDGPRAGVQVPEIVADFVVKGQR